MHSVGLEIAITAKIVYLVAEDRDKKVPQLPRCLPHVVIVDPIIT